MVLIFQIRDIFASIGFSYKPGKFEGIWLRAKEIQNTRQDRVSVDAFMKAVKELHFVK